MSDRLRHVIGLLSAPWAITPAAYDTLCAIIDRRAEGIRLDAAEIEALVAEQRNALQARAAAAASITGQARGVAVIPMYGMIVPRAGMFSAMSGATSLDTFAAKFRAADADPNIARILLDIDSPGGSAELVPETAAIIRNAKTPVTAIANTEAGSAAYWLAAQADEIVVTPSGAVGSIGVFARHMDVSVAMEQDGLRVTLIYAGRFKVEGNPYEPLGDEAKAAIQADVDKFYGMFVADVARGRGTDADTVAAGFGEGRMVSAQRAVAAGMADRVDTYESTVARLLREQTSSLRAGSTSPSTRRVPTQTKDSAPEAETPDLPATASGADKPAPLPLELAELAIERQTNGR